MTHYMKCQGCFEFGHVNKWRAIYEAEELSAGTDISLGWGRQDDVRYVKATEVLGA